MGVVARSPSDAHVGYGWLENSSITQCYLHSVPSSPQMLAVGATGGADKAFLGGKKC